VPESITPALSAWIAKKQLKKWHREWKIRTIEHDNPNWDDLSLNL